MRKWTGNNVAAAVRYSYLLHRYETRSERVRVKRTGLLEARAKSVYRIRRATRVDLQRVRVRVYTRCYCWLLLFIITYYYYYF